MIHGLSIKDGKATYAARYVQTSRLVQEERFGAPKFLKVVNYNQLKNLNQREYWTCPIEVFLKADARSPGWSVVGFSGFQNNHFRRCMFCGTERALRHTCIFLMPPSGRWVTVSMEILSQTGIDFSMFFKNENFGLTILKLWKIENVARQFSWSIDFEYAVSIGIQLPLIKRLNETPISIKSLLRRFLTLSLPIHLSIWPQHWNHLILKLLLPSGL